MDSREVSLIVHFLFNGDTSSFQTAPSARKCASIVFGKVRTIIKVSVFGKRTRLFQCKFFRHPRLELGGVGIVRRDHHRQVTNGVSSLPAILTKLKATCLPALLAPEAHVLPKLQPPLFLFRQHISPPRVVHAAAPLHTIQMSHTKKATHTHVSRLSHFVIR